MEFFWELHSNLPQEAPGDNKSTVQALRMIKDLPPNPTILDIGCGPGRQTIVLAKETDGIITAIDFHQPFLNDLERRAKNESVMDKIVTKNQSMKELNLEKEHFDLIWSEGAIYIIGFEKGLNYFRQFLKPGGYLAVTEMSWLIDTPPEEVENYWATENPGMKTALEYIDIIKNTGYRLIDWFVIPESSWDGYYGPLENKINQMRQKYAGDPDAEAFLDESLEEIDIFRKYSRTYGYVFYILKSL